MATLDPKQHSAIPPIMRAWMDINFEREAPWVYSRMSCVAAVAAALGRNVWVDYGKPLYPNFYIVLAGEPGSKKSSALMQAKQYLTLAGYNAFGADHQNRKEFIKSLTQQSHTKGTRITADMRAAQRTAVSRGGSIRDLNAWVREMHSKRLSTVYDADSDMVVEDTDIAGMEVESKSSPMFLCLSELADLCGRNPEFMTTLNNLWDSPTSYTDVSGMYIQNPIINLIGGINPASFGKVFPPTEMQSGLITRVLLVVGDKSKRSIQPFDFKDSQQQVKTIVSELARISDMRGEFTITESGKQLLRDVHVKQPKINDARFTYYYDRRHEQLMKLVMCVAAMHDSYTITHEHIMLANTILTFVEWNMANALGDYGVSKEMKNGTHIMTAIRQHEVGVNGAAMDVVAASVRGVVQLGMDMAAALQYLERSGAITISGGRYYINAKNISERSSQDGVIYDSTMIPEWLEADNRLEM